MADPKYKATNIPLNAEQRDVVNKAHEEFEREIGCKISRSVFLTMLCARYSKQKGDSK